MSELETLKQVVSNLNEAVKELQTEVKKLKGEDMESPRMYAEDMEWKEGEEEENKLLRRVLAFNLPESTDLYELNNNLCNNQWLRQKAISLGIDVSHIKESNG